MKIIYCVFGLLVMICVILSIIVIQNILFIQNFSKSMKPQRLDKEGSDPPVSCSSEPEPNLKRIKKDRGIRKVKRNNQVRRDNSSKSNTNTNSINVGYESPTPLPNNNDYESPITLPNNNDYESPITLPTNNDYESPITQPPSEVIYDLPVLQNQTSNYSPNSLVDSGFGSDKAPHQEVSREEKIGQFLSTHGTGMGDLDAVYKIYDLKEQEISNFVHLLKNPERENTPRENMNLGLCYNKIGYFLQTQPSPINDVLYNLLIVSFNGSTLDVYKDRFKYNLYLNLLMYYLSKTLLLEIENKNTKNDLHESEDESMHESESDEFSSDDSILKNEHNSQIHKQNSMPQINRGVFSPPPSECFDPFKLFSDVQDTLKNESVPVYENMPITPEQSLKLKTGMDLIKIYFYLLSKLGNVYNYTDPCFSKLEYINIKILSLYYLRLKGYLDAQELDTLVEVFDIFLLSVNYAVEQTERMRV